MTREEQVFFCKPLNPQQINVNKKQGIVNKKITDALPIEKFHLFLR